MDNFINNLIDLAFNEDIGEGDHTTLCSIPDSAIGKASLVIKEAGILAGVEVAIKVFHKLDSQLKVDVLIKDGSSVKPGDVVFTVEGKKIGQIQDILKTASNDVYIINPESDVTQKKNKKGNKEILIPALKSVVKEINLQKGYMLIELPAGLLDDT